MLASAHAAGRMRARATRIDASVVPALAVNLAPNHPRGLRLRAPVLTASGTFGFGDEYRDVVNLAALGAVVTKTVTPEPRQGNPTPRTIETPAGMLNSIGLPNPGGGGRGAGKIANLGSLAVPGGREHRRARSEELDGAGDQV